MSPIHASIQQHLKEVGEAIDAKFQDHKLGWQDSNAKHLVTQISLGAFRTEMLDAFRTLHARLDDIFVEIKGLKNG